MQTINSASTDTTAHTANATSPTPTMGDVRALKARVAQLGRDTTEELTEIAGTILTLAHTTPTNDPRAMSAALVQIAQLGVAFAEAWQDMLQLAEADKLTDLCEAALVIGAVG